MAYLAALRNTETSRDL